MVNLSGLCISGKSFLFERHLLVGFRNDFIDNQLSKSHEDFHRLGFMFIYQQNKLRRIVKSIPKLRSSTRKTMAQGKMKATAKVPKSVKKKEKGKAFTTRSRKSNQTPPS